MVRSAPYESEFKPGQRVTALAMLGGWAEQVVVPPANVTPTPDDLDDAEAVALLGNYQTMYFALATPRRAAARRDGAGAGLGRRRRHRGHSDRKGAGRQGDRDGAPPAAPTEFVESLGADVVLPLTDGWLQAVKEHTDGRGVDLVVDPIGGEAFDDAIRALATEGRLLVIGFAAGGIPTVKVNRLLLRNVSVVGVGYGEYVNRKPGSPVGVRVRGRPNWSRLGCGHRRRCGFRCRRAPTRCRAWPTAACSARSCWSRDERAAGVGVRCVRDRRRLALQHHPRARGVRPTPWAATGLAELRRRLARRLCPGDGPGAPRRAAVDEDRRPAPHDPRGAPWRGRHHVDLRRGRRRAQPRLAPARPVAGLRAPD